MMPKHTEQVPAELTPIPVAQGEDEADAELDDEGLEPVLVGWMHDPRYEDFGEEREIDITARAAAHGRAALRAARTTTGRPAPSRCASATGASIPPSPTSCAPPLWTRKRTSRIRCGSATPPPCSTSWTSGTPIAAFARVRSSPSPTGRGPDQFLVSHTGEMDTVLHPHGGADEAVGRHPQGGD